MYSISVFSFQGSDDQLKKRLKMSALYEIRKAGKMYSQLKEKLNGDNKTRVNESVGRDQCVALEDIKKGTLILNSTKEMVPEGNPIGSLYDVKKYLFNILKAFKKMRKSDQEEFLTLRNKYEDEEILQVNLFQKPSFLHQLTHNKQKIVH